MMDCAMQNKLCIASAAGKAGSPRISSLKDKGTGRKADGSRDLPLRMVPMNAFTEYAVDFWQRNALFCNVMRQRVDFANTRPSQE